MQDLKTVFRARKYARRIINALGLNAEAFIIDERILQAAEIGRKSRGQFSHYNIYKSFFKTIAEPYDLNSLARAYHIPSRTDLFGAIYHEDE